MADKVEAEGDQLKETAKHAERISNWGFFYAQREDHRFRPENSVIIDKKAYDDIAKMSMEMGPKLEAIKTHLTKWVSGHSDWQMGRMSQWKKELDEIVEGSYEE